MREAARTLDIRWRRSPPTHAAPVFHDHRQARLVPVSTTMNTPLKAHASYQYPVGIVSVDQLVLSVEI